MLSSEGVRWHCPNRDCNWSFVATAVEKSETGPRCVCGSTMKKEGAVPALHYLDFLREGLGDEVVTRTEKE